MQIGMCDIRHQDIPVNHILEIIFLAGLPQGFPGSQVIPSGGKRDHRADVCFFHDRAIDGFRWGGGKGIRFQSKRRVLVIQGPAFADVSISGFRGIMGG